MRRIHWKEIILNTSLFVFFVSLDQFSKFFALESLAVRENLELIPNLLDLIYLENEGAAFGILQGQNFLFILIACIVLLVCMYLLMKVPKKKKYNSLQFFTVMLSAGAIGNMIDRLSTGFVIDFIRITAFRFPVFNLADLYITVSSIGLIILFLFVYKDTDFAFLYFKIKKYRE